METIKTHHIFINSSMRTVGTTDDFVVTLKNPLVLTNQRNKFRVVVTDTTIPHTIRQVNSANNSVGYHIVKGVVNYHGTIALTAGNYNIISLLEELRSKLKASILTNTTLNINLTFSYIKTVSGVVLSVVGTDGIITTITLKFALNLILGSFFGYTVNAVFSYNSFNISSNSSSDIQVNVNPINNIYIRSNSLVQRDSYESIVEKDVFSDILAKVPVSVAPGSFIFYSSGSFIELENKIIDQIALYLSDNLSYSLSLNGLTWNTHLIFEEFGTMETDNLLQYSDQSVEPVPVDNSEVLSQIEELKKQIDESKNKI
jgi:hypothetical protein